MVVSSTITDGFSFSELILKLFLLLASLFSIGYPGVNKSDLKFLFADGDDDESEGTAKTGAQGNTLFTNT